MRPGPALLLLLRGLGLGLGLGPDPASAALGPVKAAQSPGVRGAGGAQLSLRPRAAPGGGLILSGGRGLCLPAGRPPSPAPRCLRALVLLRARRAPRATAAPARVDLHLTAPRGRLSLRWLARLPRSLRGLQWTFRLRPLGPTATAPASHVSRRSLSPRGPRSYTDILGRTECPTEGHTPVVLEALNPNGSQAIESSVSCQVAAQEQCIFERVVINKNKDGPVRWNRNLELTVNATLRYQCPTPQYISQRWTLFPVSSVSAVPNWNRPLRNPPFRSSMEPHVIHIRRNSLSWGVYVLNFSVTIYTGSPGMLPLRSSDSIYIVIARNPLKAVIPGDANITVNFTDRLTLNGTMSSDPDAQRPLEGLQFSWYCTTNPGNYQEAAVTVNSRDVCLPEQADLRWTGASGPVLTISPETLKGARVYFFRMVVQKNNRTAFADKTVHVLRGPAPAANISCNENCDPVLVTPDRFSLSLECTNCKAGRDVYQWSILSSAGSEIPFDWTRQTATGRNRAHLSIKAFAFQLFPEGNFSVSLHLISWSGWTLDLRHPFVIKHISEIGECTIRPTEGIALLTKFVVRCDNTKNNIPLTYKVIVSDVHGFGEISSLKENTFGAILYLGEEPTSPPSFLPVGVMASHYAVKLYIQAYNNALGAFSQATLYATVQAPTDRNSSSTVLWQLFNYTEGPNSLLSTLLQQQEFLPAGYLMYIVASILNSMKSEPPLQENKTRLQEYLFNQTFALPISTLVEISQVVMTVTKLTQKTSEFTPLSRKLAMVRIWQASQALQRCRQTDRHVSSEQVEMVSTGVLTSLSNILKQTTRYQVEEEPFHVVESLADTVLAVKVPENETTALRTSNFNMYLKKTEKWNVTRFFSGEKHCRNCFYPTLDVTSVPSLPASAPISTLFCEFMDDPFPWMNYQESSLTEVVGFRMMGTEAPSTVIEITPDVVEVHFVRRNLTFGTLALTVGSSHEPGTGDESSRKTIGAFYFQVDNQARKEVLVHIVTEVTLVLTVLVYAGRQVTPEALVTTFLVPYELPPVANQSDLFDPACTVQTARVVCLSPSLLGVLAQRGGSSMCAVTMVLQAPRFVLKPTDKVVKIALFSVQCLDMYRIQSDWREDTCDLGEKTSWSKIHCICKNPRRARRQLDITDLDNLQLHTHYMAARVIVVPNPVDLRLEVFQKVTRNPVTLLTVLSIMLLYLILAFWALHRDEMDQFLREHVVVLPDNDPYDDVCYLVTVFTGSRCGSGTRADVFIQLQGTENSSSVHCLSHPKFTTLYRASICTFLLTTKSDLGDIHAIRVWHNNEGRSPSWYLSRIKVENLFSRHIWLFMCREWLSVDTVLDRTFPVTHPDKPLNRMDFFLIDLSYKLAKSHIWFSVFSGVISKPFSRLQRLSCCLAMLLSSLLCNIMFFNLDKEDVAGSLEEKFVRSMMIGLESALITVPVQLIITCLFIYSQRRPQARLIEVSPQTPLTTSVSGHWEERLKKWHAEETSKESSREPPKLRYARKSHAFHKAAVKATSKTQHKPKQAESQASHTQRNKNTNNPNAEDEQSVASEASFQQSGAEVLQEKPRIVLPWWCVFIAWFLVFITSSVSSFFIVFYGLTYGFDKSIDWLFASICAFIQSVFVVQLSKIILLTGCQTSRSKYCKNLSWATNYRYTEIKLSDIKKSPEEMQRLQEYNALIRSSRMYQPLTEDEIRIFKRKKKIKRRAFLFLSYILTHFIFLALLLILVTLLRHRDGFYYNRFIRDQFSVDLATVTKLDDVYQWLNRVLLPLLHNDPHPTFLPDSSSQILGLPLMRQVRARPGEKACPPAKNFKENSLQKEIRCHPQYGTDPEDTKSYTGSWSRVSKRAVDENSQGFTYKPPEKRWTYTSHGLLHTYGSGGYVFYFFPKEQQSNSSLRLGDLRGSHWLDEKTWAVILELTTYNADVNLFCSVSVVFEVSQLGAVNTSMSARSFSLANFNRKTSAEIYLYVAILIFFSAYIIDEVYVMTQERASYLKSLYNLLNFALKCIFALLLVLFLRKHFLAEGITRFYLSNPEDFIPFHAVSQVDHALRVILGFLLFLTILKTLRYSRFFYDVRLAQRAIQTALPGICHMAFVVSVYFFVYMAFGYLVFGQHEWNYSNTIHATQTVFSYCVSAFQNTAFSENRVLGVLFLLSFMLVMICILINLFQAVILSAYEEMKQPVYEEPSEEAEAMAYLYHRLTSLLGCLTFRARPNRDPEFFTDVVYGQPEKSSRRYLGLKTRNINGKKMVYLVV
uniref:Polycystin family receptor for egg jelly n=1 Tax=Catagonus wagneri TaxID=51154 RepID=A0A8C3VXY3_9CETA